MNRSNHLSSVLCLLVLLGMAPTQAMQRRGIHVTSTRHGNVVKLKNLARAFDMELEADFARKAIHLRGSSQTWTFYENSRRVECENSLLWLHRPLTRSWRSWAVSEPDVVDQLLPIAKPGAYLREQGFKTVVLDPGHGGNDQGAVGGESMEKKLALKLATLVRDQLVREGFHVRLTRDDDTFIALSNRCVVAGAMHADLFVSLHFNASANGDATGIETFVLPPAGEEATSQNTARLQHDTYPGNRHQGANVLLGHMLHRRVLQLTNAKDRGLKKARFVVLRDATCPAVLLELGFLSNRQEEERIRSSDYFDRLVAGVSSGIRDYLRAVMEAKLLAP